ncbi:MULTISPECIES: hypothetical protein [Pseudorhizobium]|jgi:hypothetical protein|uniref:Uncharacterized protein n=3 Tax=Pseudorhizobium TaxID=1903858 RepID=L0NCI8_9HYPH|nr:MULTISPECIES: hypothetical protein [Pseudorhizobium]CAD6603845.1 hypothetical protein RNT25_01474 [arsenite-oxidising bacterium NT-25]CAD6609616.1 hypothetical protein RKHAN_02225 [Rhizobium sp. Khangiran2]CAD6610919.1 hypothetical protein RTCK_02317 [Rhizobium sp. TCK]MBB6178997.1 hypothetical protein [Pseudorhizobium flavum]CAD6602968.1 hypothetical protein RFYW14_01258 [Pseudorhizobium flavum]
MRYSTKRMMIAGAVALAYALVLIFYGSPLLALTTWLGWVDPQ